MSEWLPTAFIWLWVMAAVLAEVSHHPVAAILCAVAGVTVILANKAHRSA